MIPRNSREEENWETNRINISEFGNEDDQERREPVFNDEVEVEEGED